MEEALTSSKKRFMELKCNPINFLRVVAFFMVFFLHTYPTGKINCGGAEFIINTPAWAGVFIFFILSGYLIGKGFYKERYSNTFLGSLKFILSRFLKIAPAYYLFVLVCTLLTNPTWIVNQPLAFVKVILFCYNGAPGFSGVGATWFVSTIFQLYILAPLFYFLIRKLKINKNIWLGLVVFTLLLVLGMGERLLFRKLDLDWYEYIYTFSLCNLDLFFCGFVLNSLTNNFHKKPHDITIKILKISSVLLLLGFITYNSYIYFRCSEMDLFHYRFVFPTIYILLVGLYLFSFDTFKNEQKPEVTYVLKNPIDFIAGISFELYLVHSNISNAVFDMFGGIATFNGGVYLGYITLILLLCILICVPFHVLSTKINKKCNELIFHEEQK